MVQVRMEGRVLRDRQILEQGLGVTALVIISTEHFEREGFAEASGTADQYQTSLCVDHAVDQADQAALIHIIIVSDFFEALVPIIKIDPHERPSYL